MSREAFENNLLQNMELRTVFMSYPTTFLNPLNCLYTKKAFLFQSCLYYCEKAGNCLSNYVFLLNLHVESFIIYERQRKSYR